MLINFIRVVLKSLPQGHHKLLCTHRNTILNEKRVPTPTSQTRRLGSKSEVKPPAPPEYTIRKLKEIDRNQILEFLRRYFFRDEPMNQAVALLETPGSRCEEMEEFAASSLKDGVSLGAVRDGDQFIGICINGIVNRNKGLNEPKKCFLDYDNPKFGQILQVLGHLERESKIWNILPKKCKCFLELKIISVHPTWRGKGLMKALCLESEKIAKDKGACAIRIDATSAFSAKTAERLEYKKVYGIPYKDMPFAPQPGPPHTEASVYLKELA